MASASALAVAAGDKATAKSRLSRLQQLAKEAEKVAVEPDQIYAKELAGILSLPDDQAVRSAQSKKFDGLPKRVAGPAMIVEGFWYLQLYHDLARTGTVLGPERLASLKRIAGETFEVLAKHDETSDAGLLGQAELDAERGAWGDCAAKLQRWIERPSTQKSPRLGLLGRVALARAARLSGDAALSTVAEHAFKDAIAMGTKQFTRDALEQESANPSLTAKLSGVEVFVVPGVSFTSVSGTVGMWSRLSPDAQKRLLTALQPPQAPGTVYNPTWTKPLSLVVDVDSLFVGLREGTGFANDTLVRLYQANLLFQINPTDAAACVGLAQCLQEVDQLELAEPLFERAHRGAAELRKRTADPWQQLDFLDSYVFLRQGLSASAGQKLSDIDAAVKFWQQAKQTEPRTESTDQGGIAACADSLIASIETQRPYFTNGVSGQ